MTDSLFTDVSQFQHIPIDDSYPYRVAMFRSNDGTYHDPLFPLNHNHAVAKLAAGTLDVELVYAVYRPDGGAWAQTLINNVPAHSKLGLVIDVENWNGAIVGDHSDDINAGVTVLADHLGRLEGVLGYGNMGDLKSIWPRRTLAPNHLGIAAYGFNPTFPDKFYHQFTSSASVPPWGGPVDLNSADGYDIPAFQNQLGVHAGPNPPVPPTPHPAPVPPPFPLPAGYYFGWRSGPVQSVSGYFSHRADLQVWQQRMRDRGWNISADGLYGPQTNSVCLSFQRQKGLVADGKIGPVTWAAAWTLPVT